jgi:carnitine 3-dehydrogenase
MLGVDADYVANSGSYFTVETHIRHLDEVAALQPVHVTTQVLHAQGKKLHLFHRLYHGDGRLLATGEHMLIHVSLETRKASEPVEHICRRAEEIAAAHTKLDLPEGAGRAVGRK